MWHCPECGAVNEQTSLCKNCGFDDSINYIKYRTLCILPPEYRMPKHQTSQKNMEQMISRREFETEPEEILRVEKLFEEAFSGNKKAQKELAGMYRTGIVLKSQKRAEEWEKAHTANRKKQTPENKKRKWQVGDTMFFGRYPHKGQKTEPIEWYIAENSALKLLLVSKYYLDYHRYGDKADWKNSSIRKWLNEDFYAKAFTSAEKKCIFPVDTMQEKYSLPMTQNDSLKKLDYVFILSLKEEEKYFEGSESLKWATVPTLYAQIKAGWADERCWMRTSHPLWEAPKKTADSLCVPYVKQTEETNSPVRSCACNMKLAVRPAIWVDRNSGAFEEDRT